MKFMKLTAVKVEPVVAKIYYHKKNDKKYYNVKHGSNKSTNNSNELWSYSFGLSKNDFPVTDGIPELLLSEDDYIISTVKKDGEIIKDRKGNVLYNISKDDNCMHKKDIILLWEIPNRNYTDVIYTTEGVCNILGEGVSGKERGDVMYCSPAPVIEILGDVTLTWNGVHNLDGVVNRVSQTIAYDYTKNIWHVEPIVTIKIGE